MRHCLAPTILVGLLGLGAAACGDTSTEPPKKKVDMASPCGECDTICCGTKCVKTETDSKNCGGCNIVCGAEEKCVAGQCESLCPKCLNTCCVTGSTGRCIDTTKDTNNCGACGNVCDAEKECKAGQCTTINKCTSCTPSECCNNMCVDITTDPTNCGACGNACDANQVCIKSVCGGAQDGGTGGDCDCLNKKCLLPVGTQFRCIGGCCAEELLTGGCTPDISCISLLPG